MSHKRNHFTRTGIVLWNPESWFLVLLRMLSACAPHIGFWINLTACLGQDQDPSNETIAGRTSSDPSKIVKGVTQIPQCCPNIGIQGKQHDGWGPEQHGTFSRGSLISLSKNGVLRMLLRMLSACDRATDRMINSTPRCGSGT